MPGPRPLSALAHRDFRRYWLGQAVSLTGAWMQQVAQGWVVVGLTSSTTAIAVIAVAAAIPQVALLLHGGIVADRYDRRKLLLLTQVAFALLAFAYAYLVASGQLRLLHIYALAFALGAIFAFDLPASQALVPQLVPPEAIGGAVALSQAAFHGSRLVGPALAGLLIAATSPAMAFVANGVSYFAVILSLLVIRPRPLARPPSPRHRGELGEGLAFVRSSRAVFALIGFTALSASFVFPFLIAFMPVAVKQTFGGDEKALGLVMSTSGLGALTGSLALLAVPAGRRSGTTLVACASTALALAALSFAPGAVAAAAVVLWLSLSVSLALGLTNTMLQLAIPEALRGRVLSIQGLTFAALTPGAALVLGLLGERLDLRILLRIAAVAYAVLALPWLLRARLDEDPRPEGEGAARRPDGGPTALR